ncbi:hypothetical protein QJS10_CPA02g00946 [Acorus calamus]|uniref:Uncharacterized protein n=1 Tax=Acorus calamus TaxID=4465 RepID=A0AAV9FBW7_ACOCL|nr:hypothetical protein QJS10_CPA02g00946 [Acorus calamus]
MKFSYDLFYCRYKGIPVLVDHECDTIGMLDHCLDFAAIICVVGLGLVLLSDAGVGGGGGKNHVLGDALVITGTLFYAFSNVGEERCVKKKDPVEVLAMLGSLWSFDLQI